MSTWPVPAPVVSAPTLYERSGQTGIESPVFEWRRPPAVLRISRSYNEIAIPKLQTR